jgi:hypothetical protein
MSEVPNRAILTDENSWQVVGGPGDGKRLPKGAFPALQNLGVISIQPPSDKHKISRYRLDQGRLVHVDTTEVFIFYGGPKDGEMWQADKPPVPDGCNAVLPIIEDGSIKRRYAWYKREGLKLNYLETTDKDTVDAIQEVQKQDEQQLQAALDALPDLKLTED